MTQTATARLQHGEAQAILRAWSDEIRRMRERGDPCKRIGEAIGLSPKTVEGWIVKQPWYAPLRDSAKRPIEFRSLPLIENRPGAPPIEFRQRPKLFHQPTGIRCCCGMADLTKAGSFFWCDECCCSWPVHAIAAPIKIESPLCRDDLSGGGSHDINQP